jgi:hypothetical protein
MYSMFKKKHTAAASSGRSSAVQSVSLRSCLKKETVAKEENKKNRLNVQFADEPLEYSIDSLNVHLDLWTAKGSRKRCSARDRDVAETDDMAIAYLLAYDAAYVQLEGSDGAVAHELQEELVRGVRLGYRGLERYSEDAPGRKLNKILDHNSVRNEYKKLAKENGNDWETQLCTYSEDLSRDSRKWAAFMGRIDSLAAILEHLTSSQCILIPPVASVPTKQRESLIKRLLNACRGKCNKISLWSAMKCRRAVQQKCAPEV